MRLDQNLTCIRRTYKWSQMVQTRISRFCAKNNIIYSKIIGSRVGMPDCLVIIESATMYAEIKHPDDSESTVQTLKRNKINGRAEVSFVVHNFNEFLEAFQKFLANAKIYNKKLDIKEQRIYDVSVDG